MSGAEVHAAAMKIPDASLMTDEVCPGKAHAARQNFATAIAGDARSVQHALGVGLR